MKEKRKFTHDLENLKQNNSMALATENASLKRENEKLRKEINKLKKISELQKVSLAEMKVKDQIENVLSQEPNKLEENSFFMGLKIKKETTTSVRFNKDGAKKTLTYAKYYAKGTIRGKKVKVYIGLSLERKHVHKKINNYLKKHDLLDYLNNEIFYLGKSLM